MRRVLGLDVMRCGVCHSQRRLISVIIQREVIVPILGSPRTQDLSAPYPARSRIAYQFVQAVRPQPGPGPRDTGPER